MLATHQDEDTGIVEIVVDGEVTASEFEQAEALLKRIIEQDGKVRMLQVIESFSGIEPTALWNDLKFSLQHMNSFSRVAIVTDISWIEWWSKTAGAFS